MKVGFVIVNYLSAVDCERLVNELEKIPNIDSCICIVNNSDADSSFLNNLKNAHCAKFHLIDGHGNVGYARGNNIGIDLVMSKGCNNIVILNPDVSIPDLEKFGSALTNRIVSGRYIAVGFNVQGVVPFYTTVSFISILFPVIFRRLFDTIYHFLFRNNGYIQIGRVYGCAFLIEGRAFRELSLFDTNTFLYSEETIMAVVLARSRLKITYDPNIIVRHRALGSTNGHFTNFQLNCMIESMTYIFHKYYSVSYIPFARILARFSVYQTYVSWYIGTCIKRIR